MTTLIDSINAEITKLESDLTAKKAALAQLQGSSLASIVEKDISELGAFFKMFAAHIFPKSTPAPAPAPAAAPAVAVAPAAATTPAAAPAS